MKSAKNSLVYAVRSLAICSALFGAQAFAESTAVCALSIQEDTYSPQEIQLLIAKGYTVMPKPRVAGDTMSLRLTTNEKTWALVKEHRAYQIHFEMPTGMGQVPIVHFNYRSLETLPECNELNQKISSTNKLRQQIKMPIAHLNNQGTLLEAFIQLEMADAMTRGKEYPEAYVRYFTDSVKSGAKDVWQKNGDKTFDKQLHQLRRFLLSKGLVHYCRDNARLSDAIAQSCFNCVSQTLLWLGLMEDFKGGLKTGFVLYEDHLQPVIEYGNHYIDLMYGKRIPQNQIVHEPKELLGAGLARWKNIVTKWDNVDPKWWGKLNTNAKFDVNSEIAANPGNNVFAYQLIEHRGRFRRGVPPLRAELSHLMDEPNLNEEFADGEGDDFSPQMNQAAGEEVSEKRSGCQLPYGPRIMEKLVKTLNETESKILRDAMEGRCEGLALFNRPGRGKLDGKLPPPAIGFFSIGKFGFSADFPMNFQWIQENKDWIGQIYFQNSKLYQEFEPLNYVDRIQKLKAYSRMFAVQNMRPRIEKLIRLFRATDTFRLALKNLEEYDKTIIDLRNLLAVMRMMNMSFDETLEEPIRELNLAVFDFAGRIAFDYEIQSAYLNSLPEEAMKNLLLWFYKFPHLELSDFMSDYTNVANARNFNPMEFEKPLNQFFLNIIRDPKNWSVKDGSAEFSLPALKEGEPDRLSAMHGNNLPEVNLPCGDHGGLVAVCPPAAKLNVADRKKMNPKLLALLSLINPGVFFNPGDLLLINGLWSKEVAEAVREIDNNYRNRAERGVPERLLPARLYIEMAMESKVQIIRADTEPRDEWAAFFQCGMNLVSHSCVVELTDPMKASKIPLLPLPRWIDESPLYRTLIDKVPAKVEKPCDPTKFKSYSGVAISGPSVSRSENSILSSYEFSQSYATRARGLIRRTPFDYVLVSGFNGCRSYYQARKGDRKDVQLQLVPVYTSRPVNKKVMK